MRNFLAITFIALAVSFGFSQLSMAVCSEGPVDTFTCDTNAPNPDPTGVQESGNDNDITVNVLPGAGIDTLNGNGGDAIEVGLGGFFITLTGAEINGDDDGIDTGAGPMGGSGVIDIRDSNITARNNAIEANGTSSVITILNSNITGGTDGIEIPGGSNSEITITDSVINAGNEGIDGGGTDIITIENSTITSELPAISLFGGDDILTLKTKAQINGEIRCGSGFDTLVFAMDVPEEQLISLSNEIFFSDPAGDSIEINGLTYEWDECELLVAELNGVPIEPRPIPTLSQWGMIAMAGLIGIVGVLFVVRRRVAV